MKRITVFSLNLMLVFVALLNAKYAIGQDNTESHTSVTKTTTSSTGPDPMASDWYSSPWVWVGGIVLLILLIIMMTRKNNTSTNVTKTTITRTDTTGTNV